MLHARADYDRIQDPENLIGQDEPVFLLRGKDMNAPEAILAWCDLAEKNGADQKIIDTAKAHVEKMRQWQSENGKQIPDMP